MNEEKFKIINSASYALREEALSGRYTNTESEILFQCAKLLDGAINLIKIDMDYAIPFTKRDGGKS